MGSIYDNSLLCDLSVRWRLSPSSRFIEHLAHKRRHAEHLRSRLTVQTVGGDRVLWLGEDHRILPRPEDELFYVKSVSTECGRNEHDIQKITVVAVSDGTELEVGPEDIVQMSTNNFKANDLVAAVGTTTKWWMTGEDTARTNPLPKGAILQLIQPGRPRGGFDSWTVRVLHAGIRKSINNYDDEIVVRDCDIEPARYAVVRDCDIEPARYATDFPNGRKVIVTTDQINNVHHDLSYGDGIVITVGQELTVVDNLLIRVPDDVVDRIVCELQDGRKRAFRLGTIKLKEEEVQDTRDQRLNHNSFKPYCFSKAGEILNVSDGAPRGIRVGIPKTMNLRILSKEEKFCESRPSLLVEEADPEKRVTKSWSQQKFYVWSELLYPVFGNEGEVYSLDAIGFSPYKSTDPRSSFGPVQLERGTRLRIINPKIVKSGGDYDAVLCQVVDPYTAFDNTHVYIWTKYLKSMKEVVKAAVAAVDDAVRIMEQVSAKEAVEGLQGDIPMTMTDKIKDGASKALDVVKVDAEDAAWRTAGSQFTKLARDPLVGLLQRHLGTDEETKMKIMLFLQSDVGAAVVASVLSLGLSAMPASAGPVPARLARELRVKAMADVGDLVAEVIMGPLRQIMTLYLADVGSMVAQVAPPPQLGAPSPVSLTDELKVGAEVKQ